MCSGICISMLQFCCTADKKFALILALIRIIAKDRLTETKLTVRLTRPTRLCGNTAIFKLYRLTTIK